jgi:hypothetical protein
MVLGFKLRGQHMHVINIKSREIDEEEQVAPPVVR